MASAFCGAGKKALLDAVVGHNWKAALYTSAASLDEDTPAYTTTDEVPDGGGYSAGGLDLANAATGEANGTAWMDFDDVTWVSATFTARFMLIYDVDDSNRAYAVIDFGSDKTGQGGNATFVMPPPNENEAIIRI